MNRSRALPGIFKLMKLRNKLAYLILSLAVLMPLGAFAGQNADIEVMRKAFENSTKAEGVKLGDYSLVDQDGLRFELSEYFKTNKPLVVGFAYTSCDSVCPTITAELKKAVDGARGKLGDRFNVLTIAFDPARDTSKNLREYGGRFTRDFKGFRFATSDEATIARLTGQFGYFYRKNAEGGFDHIDMVSIVRPDGTIYKQVYGVRTQGASVGTRLEELLNGKPESAKSASLITKIAYFCATYDPVTGKYVVNYALLVGFLLEVIFVSAVFIAVWGRRILAFSRRRFKSGS